MAEFIGINLQRATPHDEIMRALVDRLAKRHADLRADLEDNALSVRQVEQMMAMADYDMRRRLDVAGQNQDTLRRFLVDDIGLQATRDLFGPLLEFLSLNYAAGGV